MANNNCTITIQSVVNFCSTHADLLPLSGVGGYTSEPALSLENDALSDLISDPNDWVFNRVEMPAVFTCPNRQTILFAGATAFSLSATPTGTQIGTSQAWAIDLASNNAITVSGGVVTVNFLEAHRFNIGDWIYLTGVVMTTGTTSAYNSVFSDNGTLSQWTGAWQITNIGTMYVQFAATTGQNNSDVGGAPGITNFGYATSADMRELNNNSSPPNQYPINVKRELPVVSRVCNPEKICVLADLGTGVLKIRWHMVPGSTMFSHVIVYQARAPLKTVLTPGTGSTAAPDGTWYPFPDQYAAVYRQALLYRMYRYLNDAKADNEYKKLQAEIAKVQATDDATQTDTNLQPEVGLMDDSYSGVWGYWGLILPVLVYLLRGLF
jgi:hypothetical protein